MTPNSVEPTPNDAIHQADVEDDRRGRSMNPRPSVDRKAVIVGASSGIGEAVARRLHADGWHVELIARRRERLLALAESLGDRTGILVADVAQIESARTQMMDLLTRIGSVDLVVVSAGVGDENPDLNWAVEGHTLGVNVTGFAAVSSTAFQHFRNTTGGHLIGITSVAALRGSGQAASYAASKAFESVYLDGLRQLAADASVPIFVTEAQPGFVDTAMMKADKPFWVISADKAAHQIQRAIVRRPKHIYVGRRWTIIAWVLRHLPRPG